jgi:Mrp family chromosome partitioning ATPase/capsular polysaccharide biosynthesis protein
MPATYDGDAAGLPAAGPGLLSALRRYWLLVIACVIVAGAIGGAITYLLPTHYSAEARVVLGNQNQVTVYSKIPVPNATVQAQNAVQIMRSQQVYDRASTILKGRLSAATVERDVNVAPGEANNPLVTVKATTSSAALSRDLANAEGQAYLDITTDQVQARAKNTKAQLTASQDDLQSQLTTINQQSAARAAALQKAAKSISDPADRAHYIESELASDTEYLALRNQATTLTTNLNTVKTKLQQTSTDNALLEGGVDTLYRASKPSNPTASDLKRNVVIAAALGLLIGAAFAWRRQDRKRGLDPELIALALGTPLLATIGRQRELRNPTRVVDLAPGRPLSDDLRGLASSLLLHLRRADLAGMVVTSVGAGEGRTVLALNVAAAADSSGHDVVLVDADTRRPTLAAAFGVTTDPGLFDLAGPGPVGPLAEQSYAPGRSMPVLTIGGRIAAGDSAPDGLPRLRRTDGSVPVTVVDSPAVFDDPLALWLAASDRAGLVVVVTNATRLDDLRTLRARAELAGAPLVGFVVNQHAPGRRAGGPPAGRTGRRAATVSETAAVPSR